MEVKYLRMPQGMKKTGPKERAAYILLCGDGSLSTRIAKNVQTRIKQHRQGRGATHTRTRMAADDGKHHPQAAPKTEQDPFILPFPNPM